MRHDPRQGSVLIIVLLVLAAAAYLIMESGKFLRIDYEGAAYQRVITSGGNLLRSGLTVAREVLLEDIKKDNNSADYRFEEWGQAEAFFKELSEPLESGDIEGRIEAEDGRIDLNSLNVNGGAGDDLREIFLRVVASLCTAHRLELKPKDFLASIRIWLGAKDTRKDKEWYAQREVPYEIGKNFRTPEELLLVRWKDATDEDRAKVVLGADGVPGLLEFVTVWKGTSTAQINMNMAPREIVAAVCPQEDFREDFVREVEAYRADEANIFSTPWYQEIAKRIGVDMNKFPRTALGWKSSVFRVSLTARVGAGQLNSTTILKREPTKCVVMFENIH